MYNSHWSSSSSSNMSGQGQGPPPLFSHFSNTTPSVGSNVGSQGPPGGMVNQTYGYQNAPANMAIQGNNFPPGHPMHNPSYPSGIGSSVGGQQLHGNTGTQGYLGPTIHHRNSAPNLGSYHSTGPFGNTAVQGAQHPYVNQGSAGQVGYLSGTSPSTAGSNSGGWDPYGVQIGQAQLVSLAGAQVGRPQQVTIPPSNVASNVGGWATPVAQGPAEMIRNNIMTDSIMGQHLINAGRGAQGSRTPRARPPPFI